VYQYKRSPRPLAAIRGGVPTSKGEGRKGMGKGDEGDGNRGAKRREGRGGEGEGEKREGRGGERGLAMYAFP